MCTPALTKRESHGTLGQKGFRNFVESPRYSRISPRGRDLKGRQVKVPHRVHTRLSFFPAVSVPLFRLSHPPPSYRSPSIPASLCIGPDVALSRARTPLSFFRGERSGTCGTKVSELRCVALHCDALRRVTLQRPLLSVTFAFVQRSDHWRKHIGI